MATILLTRFVSASGFPYYREGTFHSSDGGTLERWELPEGFSTRPYAGCLDIFSGTGRQYIAEIDGETGRPILQPIEGNPDKAGGAWLLNHKLAV